jgi:hypothetical protein
MEEISWLKKIYKWTPHGRRRRGRPQQSWRAQVTDFMRSRNMEEDMAEDRLFKFPFHIFNHPIGQLLIHPPSRIVSHSKVKKLP